MDRNVMKNNGELYLVIKYNVCCECILLIIGSCDITSIYVSFIDHLITIHCYDISICYSLRLLYTKMKDCSYVSISDKLWVLLLMIYWLQLKIGFKIIIVIHIICQKLFVRNTSKFRYIKWSIINSIHLGFVSIAITTLCLHEAKLL